MEENIELADILEETDQTVDAYRKENKDLRQKLWKAIQKLKDKDAKVNDIEQELEVAKDEIDELYEKLHQTNQEVKDLQRNRDKERAKNEKEKNQNGKLSLKEINERIIAQNKESKKSKRMVVMKKVSRYKYSNIPRKNQLV